MIRFLVIGQCNNQQLWSVRENRNTVCLPSYAALSGLIRNVSRDIECRYQSNMLFICYHEQLK